MTDCRPATRPLSFQVKRTRRDGDHVAIQSHVSPFSATWGGRSVSNFLFRLWSPKWMSLTFLGIECPSYLADCWHTYAFEINRHSTTTKIWNTSRPAGEFTRIQCNSLFRIITFWKDLTFFFAKYIAQLPSRCHGDARCTTTRLWRSWTVSTSFFLFFCRRSLREWSLKDTTSLLQTHT